MRVRSSLQQNKKLSTGIKRDTLNSYYHNNNFPLEKWRWSFVCRFISDLSRIHNRRDTLSATRKRTQFENFIYVSFNDKAWVKEYKVAKSVWRRRKRKSEPSSSPRDDDIQENCLLTLTMKIWSDTIKQWGVTRNIFVRDNRNQSMNFTRLMR